MEKIMNAQNKFNELFNQLKNNGTLDVVKGPRMDNWACDTWRIGKYFARMSDGGYCQQVGCVEADNKVWIVNFQYPQDLTFSNIDANKFEEVTIY